ncbi:ATP-dependent zinc metalloprotease FtsH [Salinactinospora qingdaonensis]|uniref:ATP-dependent zinc metalloprotease FtsH n=1 Tax=Salinactinospora qingdaonensis TaxID=702744 RepID=A0ABP7G9C1_9ACTN
MYRGPWLWLAAIALMIIVFTQFTGWGSGDDHTKADTSKVSTLIQQDQVKDARIIDKEQRIELTTTDGDKYESFWVGGQGEEFATELQSNLDSGNLEAYDVEVPQDNIFVSVLFTFLPILLIVGLFLFLMNQMQGGGSRVMNFGKSKAKLITKDTPKSTFVDVAGADEAIEELQEIKEFLQNPAKFQQMGAKIPKGVLLYGPPGTGKTLLARAVAGEAGVPFYSISGSDFVEMFVGVGASRVRDLFEQAKANSPAIIFVDEIDAVGRHRGAGLGGGHDEREQTLNQMLVEMDGFDVNSGVILIAATNRPDILDPALLRPGRFDRQIVIDPPDLEGRKGILAVHAKGKPIAPDVDMDVIARRTPGFTGADLANVINESALLSARAGNNLVDMRTLEEAIDRVMAGPERKTRVMSDDEKKMIAYHEGGHALVAHALPNSDPVHKVTILPRGRALGYTMTLPTEDKFLTTRSEMMDQLAMMLGGRTAEEMVFHEPTTGAANDIDKATSLARKMITEYGMSERLGARKFGDGSSEPFVGREMSHSRDYSEEIASIVDEEVRSLIESAHDEAWEILVEYRQVLDELVLGLLDRETLSKEEVLEIFSPVRKRASRGSYKGYGKRQPSDKPPVMTPQELALLSPQDVEELTSGNGHSAWSPQSSWNQGSQGAERGRGSDDSSGGAGAGSGTEDRG